MGGRKLKGLLGSSRSAKSCDDAAGKRHARAASKRFSRAKRLPGDRERRKHAEQARNHSPRYYTLGYFGVWGVQRVNDGCHRLTEPNLQLSHSAELKQQARMARHRTSLAVSQRGGARLDAAVAG